MRPSLLRNVLLPIAALAAALALVACGGDDETTTSASETTSSSTTEETASVDGESPDEVAKAFLLAIADGDGETACGYASEAALAQIEAGGSCTEQVTQALGSISKKDRADVEDATFEVPDETEDSATVTATKPNGTEESFTLVIEDGQWKIDG